MHAFGLRRTTLNPRLFQQTCRLASTRRAVARVKRQAASTPPPSQVQSWNKKKQEDEADGIRWFEQDVQSGATRRLEGNPEEMEAEDLRRKIMVLEKELQEYRADSDDDLLAALDPKERAKVKKALEERKRLERLTTGGLAIKLNLPPLSLPLLNRLNAALRDAALHPNMVTRRKDLWRWYSRARSGIPALSTMIPEKAWKLLWDSQSVDLPTNPDRLDHMEQLLVDMASAGFELFPNQNLVHVDTLLSSGKIDRALTYWQRAHDSSSEPSQQLMALGVRLFSENGLLDRAHSILLQLFTDFPEQDARIILPLLAATVSAGKETLAFSFYVLMQSKLGRDMNMDDYDHVYLTFLEAGKKELALAVFRDMMLQGNKQIQDGFLKSSKQGHLYATMLRRMKDTSDPAEINNISLASMAAMPSVWHNKYFFGSWLKKLIGMGQLEAATKVVELMYERGCKPDPKHLNGLVGAFLRSQDKHLQDKGEQLAWTMIQQRLEFAYRRRQEQRANGVGELEISPMPSIHQTNQTEVKIPPHLARQVPCATMETFNILALHYFLNEKWSYIHHLDRMRRPAHYKMDSFFMNHMLHMWLNNSNEKAMWSFFIKQAQHTSPDMETYNCLWTGELHHLDPRKNRDRSGYPPPRLLFTLMTTWLYGLDGKRKTAAIGDFDVILYSRIVSSFCSDKDFAGCLVALHGIAHHFGHFPDPDIARMVVTGISNLPEAQWATIRGRRDRQQLAGSEARLKNASKVLSMVARDRATKASENNIDITQLNSEAQKKESLNTLSEFIRVVLMRVYGDADSVEAKIQEAAETMALQGLVLGDKDASNVM